MFQKGHGGAAPRKSKSGLLLKPIFIPHEASNKPEEPQQFMQFTRILNAITRITDKPTKVHHVYRQRKQTRT